MLSDNDAEAEENPSLSPINVLDNIKKTIKIDINYYQDTILKHLKDTKVYCYYISYRSSNHYGYYLHNYQFHYPFFVIIDLHEELFSTFPSEFHQKTDTSTKSQTWHIRNATGKSWKECCNNSYIDALMHFQLYLYEANEFAKQHKLEVTNSWSIEKGGCIKLIAKDIKN